MEPAFLWMAVAGAGGLLGGIAFALLLVSRGSRRQRRPRVGHDGPRATVAAAAASAPRNPQHRTGTATADVTYADPEQTLRLNAVRDIAHTLDASAFRLQQSSVRTMTAMMRLRRALAAPGQTEVDPPPEWMLRARAPQPLPPEPATPAEDEVTPPILQFPR